MQIGDGGYERREKVRLEFRRNVGEMRCNRKCRREGEKMRELELDVTLLKWKK